MHNTHEILSLRKSSDAGSIDVLLRAVRSVLADAWHSPAGVRSLAQPGHVRTHVGIALDPRLLQHMQARDANRLTHELCLWMRSLHVEYTVGYLPQQTVRLSHRGEHRLTVELFRSGP